MYNLNNSVTQALSATAAQAYVSQPRNSATVQQASALLSDDFTVVYQVYIQLLLSLCWPTNRSRAIRVRIN